MMTPVEPSPSLPGLALVVLDVQPVLVRTLCDGDSFLRRCCFAVEAAGAFNIPVIFTEQIPEKLGSTSNELLALAPGARIFAKPTFSCFGIPEFDFFLQEQGFSHLLIAGLETPICVYQSVLEGRDKDYDITLLSDCLGARRQADARNAIQAMASTGAHVLPSETIAYSILRSSGHPAFRQITSLVKKYS